MINFYRQGQLQQAFNNTSQLLSQFPNSSTLYNIPGATNAELGQFKDHYQSMRLASGFYSLSEFQDLLFHIQEYRVTIPKIQNCLDELGLKFCSFDTDRIVRIFKLTSTGEDNLYDLDQWNTDEQANPSAFTGMYQFWCQKVF